MKNILLIKAVLILLSLTSITSAQETLSINVKIKPAEGMCIIAVNGGNAPGTEKPMELEFTYLVSKGLFRARILVNGWPNAQEADPNHDFPVVLSTASGQKSASSSGGYSSGFNDSLWGIWDAGDAADNALSLFYDAKSVNLTADGTDFGYFDLSAEGMIYNWINNCAAEKRANGE